MVLVVVLDLEMGFFKSFVCFFCRFIRIGLIIISLNRVISVLLRIFSKMWRTAFCWFKLFRLWVRVGLCWGLRSYSGD